MEMSARLGLLPPRKWCAPSASVKLLSSCIPHITLPTTPAGGGGSETAYPALGKMRDVVYVFRMLQICHFQSNRRSYTRALGYVTARYSYATATLQLRYSYVTDTLQIHYSIVTATLQLRIA